MPDERDVVRFPEEGDSAVKKGTYVRWHVIELTRHMGGDIAWIRMTNPESRTGKVRSITLYEWANEMKEHKAGPRSSSPRIL